MSSQALPIVHRQAVLTPNTVERKANLNLNYREPGPAVVIPFALAVFIAWFRMLVLAIASDGK